MVGIGLRGIQLQLLEWFRPGTGLAGLSAPETPFGSSKRIYSSIQQFERYKTQQVLISVVKAIPHHCLSYPLSGVPHDIFRYIDTAGDLQQGQRDAELSTLDHRFDPSSTFATLNESSMSDPVLSQGVGYGVVVGMGLFFSAFMIGLTKVQTRYTSLQTSNAEEFTSASRR